MASDRSRTLIVSSRALIIRSLERIARTRRRIILMVAGGSTSLVEPERASSVAEPGRSTSVPEPERSLRTTTPATPRVFAGFSRGSSRCSRCGMYIAVGAPEYEVVLGRDRMMLLDRDCFFGHEKWEGC